MWVVNGSVGGSAAAGGFRFEIQMGALLATYALTEHPLSSELSRSWPKAAGRLTRIGLQSGFKVDDVAAYTSDAGLVVIQAKKALKLATPDKSPLAEALKQAVRMFRAGRSPFEFDEGLTQSWNSATDRIVIATDAGAPENVREDLVKVVARLATAHATASEDQLVNSNGERKALQVFRNHVQRLWEEESGAAITLKEFRSFCSVVRIMAFDLRPRGQDLSNARAVLANVLTDRTQVGAAWNTLLSTCQDLSADRQFASSEDLRGFLVAEQIGVRDIVRNVGEVGPRFTPEAVLGGPSTSGARQTQLTEADELLKTDPRAAANLYKSVMAELERDGYPHVAAKLLPRLTRALRECGQHRAAVRAAVAAAWRPIRLGEVPSGFPERLALAEELRKSSTERSRSGDVVIAVLLYEEGSASLSEVAEYVAKLEDGDEHVADLVLWLAEEAIAAHKPDLFVPLCERALVLAAEMSSEEGEVAGRLRIAVAECCHEWPALLTTIEGDYGAPLYVLAKARHGQALAWRNQLPEAIASFEEAIKRGTEEQMNVEVRTWLYDIRALRGASFGPGRQTHDTHFTAQSLPSTYKMSVFAGGERLLARGLEAFSAGNYERAHRILMRLRHRMAGGAALIDQRQSEAHLGDILIARNLPGLAIDHYLRAGNHKKASTVIEQQPDGPLVPDQAWFVGPMWQTQAAYEFLGKHGDLVPEAAARVLFDDLAGRLVTSGSIRGWSNFQANEKLFKPLTSLAWASSPEAAEQLIFRLAPIAQIGGLARVIQVHVDLVLGCAQAHSELTEEAARQFVALVALSDQAVPTSLEFALKCLAPHKEVISEQLLETFLTDKAPWLASVLVELEVHHSAVIEYVNAALDREAKPREYAPDAMSFGSVVVNVARLSRVGDANRRARFVDAMLAVAVEQRESYDGRHEAVNAITAVAQLCDAILLDDEMKSKIRNLMRPLVSGQGAETLGKGIVGFWMGSSKALMLAASRLLLILSDDEEEQERMIRSLLLNLIGKDLDEPRLLRSALAQVPAEVFRRDLLVLAVSQFPMIRALAAHLWTELPSTELDIGRRLAEDPHRVVRQALAHGLNQSSRSDADDIRTILSQDCRFSVRAEIQ